MPAFAGMSGARSSQLHRADCHRDRGLRRIDHRNAERILQRLAMTRHAGASHHDRVRAILVLQRPSDFDHPRQRLLACGFGNRQFERTLAGEAIGEPHLAQIAHVARDRALQDRDHPEALGARQRGQHAAFGDPEHRPRRPFAADMQAGIAVAGDHEGIAGVVRLDEPPQRQRDALHMLLRLDPEWALGQGRADDLRPVSKAQRRNAHRRCRA